MASNVQTHTFKNLIRYILYYQQVSSLASQATTHFLFSFELASILLPPPPPFTSVTNTNISNINSQKHISRRKKPSRPLQGSEYQNMSLHLQWTKKKHLLAQMQTRCCKLNDRNAPGGMFRHGGFGLSKRKARSCVGESESLCSGPLAQEWREPTMVSCKIADTSAPNVFVRIAFGGKQQDERLATMSYLCSIGTELQSPLNLPLFVFRMIIAPRPSFQRIEIHWINLFPLRFFQANRQLIRSQNRLAGKIMSPINA